MLNLSFNLQVTLHLPCHLSATFWELGNKVGHVNVVHLHVRAECRVRARQTEGKIACGMPAMSLHTEVREEHLFRQYSQMRLNVRGKDQSEPHRICLEVALRDKGRGRTGECVEVHLLQLS
jgi:hypothetical protein